MVRELKGLLSSKWKCPTHLTKRMSFFVRGLILDIRHWDWPHFPDPPASCMTEALAPSRAWPHRTTKMVWGFIRIRLRTSRHYSMDPQLFPYPTISIPLNHQVKKIRDGSIERRVNPPVIEDGSGLHASDAIGVDLSDRSFCHRKNNQILIHRVSHCLVELVGSYSWTRPWGLEDELRRGIEATHEESQYSNRWGECRSSPPPSIYREVEDWSNECCMRIDCNARNAYWIWLDVYLNGTPPSATKHKYKVLAFLLLWLPRHVSILCPCLEAISLVGNPKNDHIIGEALEKATIKESSIDTSFRLSHSCAPMNQTLCYDKDSSEPEQTGAKREYLPWWAGAGKRVCLECLLSLERQRLGFDTTLL